MMKKRKLLTYLSLLIIMMMVPIGAKAENNVYLHGDHFSGSTGWANTKTNYGSGSDWYVIVDASTMENNSIYGWGLKADNVSWSADGKTVDMTSSSSESVTWSSTSTTNNSLKHSSSYKAYKVHLTKSNGNWTSVFTGYTYDLIQFKGGYNSWNPSDFNYNSTTGEYTFDIPASSVTGNFEFGILINGQWNGNSSSPTMDMTGGFQSLNTTQGGNMIITYSNSYTSYTVKVKKESGTWKVAVIGNTPTANITFSPTSTTFSTSTLNVTLTSSNSRDIYYTLDGSTPTTSSSHVTSGTAVTVTGTTTLTAGVLNSAGTALEGISSQTYTYNNGGGSTNGAFYMVSNFYNNNESGMGSISTSDRSMKFKKNENGNYYFKIPASLYGRFRIYDATANKYYSLTNDNSTFMRGTISNASGTLTESSSYYTTVTGNYYSGTKPTEGDYTITINPTTKAYTVTYNENERVVYIQGKDNGTLDMLLDTRSNNSTMFDHNFFGNTYFENGFKVVANFSANNVSNDEKEARVTFTNEKCYLISYLQILGDGDNHGVNSWYDTSVNASAYCHPGMTGAYNVEFNPERGSKNWGNVLIKAGNGGNNSDPIVSALHIIGPAIPGTTSGDTWNYASALPMTYDKDENCWTVTVNTTNAQTATNVFRFIDGTTVTKNWGENSTAAAEQARIPYTDNSATGHKADPSDPNVVGLVTNGTTADRGGYGDIIFNRPAGTWTVKFYVDATNVGTTYTTVYRYTIDGTESTDPDATLSPGVDNGNYTYSNYTANTSEDITVTLSNGATGYDYAFGANADLSVSSTNTSATSLKIRYTGTNSEVSFDNGSTWTPAAAGNTFYMKVRGNDGTNTGVTHTYQYTFDVPSVALDFSPKSGFYINKVNVTITGGTAPYTYTVKDRSGNVLSSGTTSTTSFYVSTPGYLTVEDSNNGSAVSDDPFDFTYSTSENYANYYNNGTTAQSVAQAGGKEATNIFLKKADYQNMRIYAWDYTYDNLIKAYQNGESTAIDSELAELGVTHDGGSDWSTTKDAFNERDPLVMLSDKYPGTLMSDSRSIKIDGEDYYYLTLPLTRLHANGDEVGVIVTRNDTDPTDLSSNADIYKTGDNHVTGNSSFIYSSYEDPRFTSPTGDNVLFFNNSNNWTKVKVYLWSGEGESKVEKTTWANAEEMSATATAGIYSYDAGAAWENVIFYNGDNTTNKTGDLPYGGGRVYYKPDGTHKTTYINKLFNVSDLVEPDGDVVFFDKANSTGASSWNEIYCYAWKNGNESQKNANWPGVLMAEYKTGMYIEDVDHDLYDRIIFTDNKGNQTGDIVYEGGKKTYTYDGSTTTAVEKTIDQDRYTTFINTPSSYTVEVQNHPNGDDYLKAVPYDKTILLDPTWNGEITPKELSDEETSVPSWNGVEGNVSGYRKFVNKNLTQTIYGLDNSKTYTVQAIVRVWGEQNAKVTLKVGNGTAVDSKALNSSGISYVNKNGRVDDLYTQGPDPDDPYFLKYNNNVTQGFGWQKIEASGTPTDAGNLVISLSFDKGTSVQYDLADVVLLEEANTAGHFWTKLPSDAASAIAAGELDMTNRSTYNAFSFFDRNEGNPNAIIKANNRTVIGLNSGIADIESGKDAIDHRQLRNTISLNEDGTTWSGLYLYLYDMSGNKTDCNAYGPTVDFTMKGAKYDRAFTSGQHSTLFLPFNLTTSQLKAAGFTQLSNINSINSVNSEIVLNTWDLTKETPTDYTALAGQGYIVVAGGSGASLSDFIKPTGGISVQKASNGQTSEATGFVGTYVFGRKYQTEGGYMNYSYQNDKFRPLKSLEDGGATMKPFRAILAVPTSTSAPMFSTSHFYVEDDYVPTNIQTIDMSGEKGGNIYTVDGRLVRTDGTVNSLPRGIYIQNNKKFVVK